MSTSETSNDNGKRPRRDTQPSSRGAKHVHKSSGYTWDKAEDEPGHAWKGKKNAEEFSKAMEQVVDRQIIIGRMQPHEHSLGVGLENIPAPSHSS